MSRPKKEEYIPRSISEGKPSPVCISVEKFLEMDEKIKQYETALTHILNSDTVFLTGDEDNFTYEKGYKLCCEIAEKTLDNFTNSK